MNKKQAVTVCRDTQPVSPHMNSIASFDDLCSAYHQFVADDPEHRCPQCDRRRCFQGSHDRWVLWSRPHRDRLSLVPVRCRACGTVETLFPPWLLPHEELTVDALNQVLEAVNAGHPVWQVAAEWGMEPLAIRRRIRRWLPQAADLRQRVAQQADTWGIPLAWPTWTPPTGSRSADWSWLLVAWMALFLTWGGASVWSFSVGLSQWREWAPENLPAPVVPARSHLGRRLRGVPPRPPRPPPCHNH